jgi:DNA-binding CsgD family transcriptional regulator
MRNPAVTSWRATASAAWLSMEDPDKARALAAENLELAREFGSPWVIGTALCVAAHGANGGDPLDLLTEAVHLLESSGASLEYARALIDLGTALREDAQTEAAQATLRQGADLAYRCGAARLADRAARELRASGARPRRLALSGTHALTPAERRVVALAVAGCTNSRIAEKLYVAEKTVEGHLARAYRKLGIRSRKDLPSAV